MCNLSLAYNSELIGWNRDKMTSLFPDDRTLRLLCRVKIRVRKIHNRHVAKEMSLYPKKVEREEKVGRNKRR